MTLPIPNFNLTGAAESDDLKAKRSKNLSAQRSN